MAKELTFFCLFFIAELHKRCEPTVVDCRVEALCDTNAACTADPGDANHFACVCKEGFFGSGTVCQGKLIPKYLLNCRILVFSVEVSCSGTKCLRFVVYNWFIQCFSCLLTNFD